MIPGERRNVLNTTHSVIGQRSYAIVIGAKIMPFYDKWIRFGIVRIDFASAMVQERRHSMY